MSKIDKLSILGVRSFDNGRGETIQFYSPLTLVVGFNGSGKTTIIECLKYAATGLLPPNSKGGAFIHDPKLAGEREVLAQVKLSFKAATGAKMVATRSLQLTVKRLARQQRTLEGQLLMVKEGERTAISSRVAELDQIIPQYLGVSTAVIDNVIFCHQDESLWPLSEPSVLKKKFDEIFEAQKYTKAIENIKQLRKKQNEELGKHKIIEQHAKEDKIMAEKTERRMLKLQDEIEALRQQCGQLERQMLHVVELAHEAHQQYNRYEALSTSLKTKQDDAASRQAILASLESSMKEISESDEWLTATLEQFDSRIQDDQSQREALLEAFREVKVQIDAQQADRVHKLAEKGRNEAEQLQYQRHLRNRHDLVKDLARRHSLKPQDDVTNSGQFDDFMLQFNRVCREQSKYLTHAREDANRETQGAQVLINKLDQRQKALQESKLEARKLIAQHSREQEEARKQIDAITVDEGSPAVLQSRKEDVGSRLQQAEAEIQSSSRQKNLGEATARVAQLETDSRALRELLVQSTRRSDEVAELVYLKKMVKDNLRSLETMTRVYGERIAKVVGKNWQPSEVEEFYQTAVESRSQELGMVEKDRNVIARDLEQVEFTIDKLKSDIKEKEALLEDCRQKIRDAIDDEPSEYEEILQERQRGVDSMKDDAGQMAGLSSFLQQILNVANEKGLCRTCSRPFRNETELSRFKIRMDGLVRKAHSETQDDEIRELERDLQAARDAAIQYETWKQLSTELPRLKEQQARLDRERDRTVSRLTQCEGKLGEQQEGRRELDALSKVVQSIIKHNTEIRDHNERIEQLSRKQVGGQSESSVDEIQERMNGADNETREARDVVYRLTKEEEDNRRTVSQLRLESSRLDGELNSTNYQLEKKANLLSELKKVQHIISQQREAMDNADEEIERLDIELAQAREAYDEIEQRATVKQRDLQRRVDESSKHLQDLKYANDMIREYVEAEGPQQLSKIERELKQVADDIAAAEGQQLSLTRDINSLKERIDQSESVRRNYSDNLQYRRMRHGLQAVEEEIRQLGERVSNVDASHYREEGSRRDREHHLISGQREGKMGEMKSKDNQLAELLADYETDYKDAARKYKEAHIKTETTKAAVEDLARYGSALDKAIMTYHAVKMQEINGIIEELWQRTYQGTDVDTILIRSDNENAKGNRNYNYRVSMVKQDAEMDMRGRCSAGQKVLASIIIRLALAECFGVNCGLIALDEPTTNLDRDNIRSLAESLHDIIRHRQQQANFQLIVITHDEDFLRHMKCGDFADYYYRISRTDKQKSIIERQAIAEVL